MGQQPSRIEMPGGNLQLRDKRKHLGMSRGEFKDWVHAEGAVPSSSIGESPQKRQANSLRHWVPELDGGREPSNGQSVADPSSQQRLEVSSRRGMSPMADVKPSTEASNPPPCTLQALRPASSLAQEHSAVSAVTQGAPASLGGHHSRVANAVGAGQGGDLPLKASVLGEAYLGEAYVGFIPAVGAVRAPSALHLAGSLAHPRSVPRDSAREESDSYESAPSPPAAAAAATPSTRFSTATSSGHFTPEIRRRALQDMTNSNGLQTDGTGPSAEPWLKQRPPNFLQSKVTIAELTLARFTPGKRCLFVGSVAAAVDVTENEVEIVNAEERSGRRLLSSNLEVTIRVRVPAGPRRDAVLQALHSPDLNDMLLQSGMRARNPAASPAPCPFPSPAALPTPFLK